VTSEALLCGYLLFFVITPVLIYLHCFKINEQAFASYV